MNKNEGKIINIERIKTNYS